jgi:hypothetical protein
MINKTIKIAIPIALAGLLLSSCAPTAPETTTTDTVATTEDNWSELTESMDGWHALGDANWHWEGNELVADEASGASYLITDESFADFQIQLEFWNHEGANSGVYMRIQNPETITDSTAYEANIYDDRADQSGRTGGIPNFLPPSEALDTWDKWNTYDITMDGNHVVVLLNGVKTVDGVDDHFSSGPIALQYGSGTIKFRNVRIRRL